MTIDRDGKALLVHEISVWMPNVFVDGLPEGVFELSNALIGGLD